MKQSGYAMLFGLFIMLGVSSMWVVRNTAYESAHRRDQSLELDRSRNALISYATNYIDHYGAEGAGVGHLPCPDTDAPNPAHKDPWTLDGPNPPCSKHDVELGWLPRHVNTASGRYHFHTRQRQRLWYAVSGTYVNNPVNRIVNPDTVGNVSIGSANDIVAVLTTPPYELDGAVSESWWTGDRVDLKRKSYTIIRSKDIRVPTMQRVSDWLLVRLTAAAKQRCNSSGTEVSCLSNGFANHDCTFSAEIELLFWLSTGNSGSNCDAIKRELLAQFALFEEAPYARHWFIRNRWYDFVQFDIEPSCVQVAGSACKLLVKPIVSSDRNIVIALR